MKNGALRVGIVSLYFHPDMSGTSFVLTDLALGLSQMGCEVSAYTTHAAFGSGLRSAATEVYQGVRIRRLSRSGNCSGDHPVDRRAAADGLLLQHGAACLGWPVAISCGFRAFASHNGLMTGDRSK